MGEDGTRAILDTTTRSNAGRMLLATLLLSTAAPSATAQERPRVKNPYGTAPEDTTTEDVTTDDVTPKDASDAPPRPADHEVPSGDEAGSTPAEEATGPWLDDAMKRPLKVPAQFEGPEAQTRLKPLHELKQTDDAGPSNRVEALDDLMASAQLSQEPYVPSPRAQSSSDFLLPSGLVEVGGELVFVTSRRRLGGDRIDFTDVGLLRLRARHAVGQHLELFAATHLLAKQPQSADEELWQEGFAGVRSPFGRWFAVELGGGGGPLLEERGYWWRFGSELLFKKPVEDYVRFQLGAGLAATGLSFRPRAAAPFWFEEVVTHAEVQFGEDEGGAWIGFDYRVPFAEAPTVAARAGSAERTLDVGTTLSLALGAILPVEDTGWDLFAVFAVIDRGELDDPNTQLPILDGGFDQTQLSAGVVRRIGETDPDERERRRRERRRRRGKLGPVVILEQD